MKAILILLVLGRAAFAQTTLNMSQDLVPLGIASSNMVPDRPDLDTGPLFFVAVDYALKHQIARVIADRGAYYLRSQVYPGSHVVWDGHNNLIGIDGQRPGGQGRLEVSQGRPTRAGVGALPNPTGRRSKVDDIVILRIDRDGRNAPADHGTAGRQKRTRGHLDGLRSDRSPRVRSGKICAMQWRLGGCVRAERRKPESQH